MKYYEVRLRPAEVDEDMREVVEQVLSYELAEVGFESFIRPEDGRRLLAYVPVDKYDAKSVERVLEECSVLYGEIGCEVAEMEDKNWNEEWEKHYFRPVEVIPGEVVVRASFHEAVEGVPTEIIIDPKMAFGTGNHATTAGMMRLIGRLATEGKQVLDMGCGSGILGIYAMKKGAKACTSVDIDPWSVDNAIRNAEVNGVMLDVREGDASILDECPRADLFLANINRNIILADLEKYLACVQVEGDLLLSGFLTSDVEMITDALKGHGWEVSDSINHGGDWVALHCRSSRI